MTITDAHGAFLSNSNVHEPGFFLSFLFLFIIIFFVIRMACKLLRVSFVYLNFLL